MPVNQFREIHGSGSIERFVRFVFYGNQPNGPRLDYTSTEANPDAWPVDANGKLVYAGTEPNIKQTIEHRHQLPIYITAVALLGLCCASTLLLINRKISPIVNSTPTVQQTEIHWAPAIIPKPTYTPYFSTP